MQATAQAVKDVLSSDDSSSKPKPGQFDRGYQPDPTASKESQGGDDSRPPGVQRTMPGAPPCSFFPTEPTRAGAS